MDVDNYHLNAENSSSSHQTQIVDSNPGSPQKSPKERLIDLLDQVEIHVERLRRDALKLEEEKDTLLTTLDTIRNSEMMVDLSEEDREDVVRGAERAAARCLTVEVAVRTPRDGPQTEALHAVNGFIDALVVALRGGDARACKARCVAFMNACSSQHAADAAADKNFEAAILGCALDDQKRVKRRLQGLLDYIDQLANARKTMQGGGRCYQRDFAKFP